MKFITAYRTPILIALIVLASGGAYWYVSSNRAPSFGTVAASTGTVTQSLDEPGTVDAENSAQLSFQTAGQITSLNVHEGQAIAAGTVLASLDTSALQAALDQANAGVAAAQARLDSLESGTRPEQIAINETAVTNTKASLGAAIGSAYAAADDAIHNQTDGMFTNPNRSNPVFQIQLVDTNMQNSIQNDRVKVGVSLAAWYAAMNATSSDPASLASTAVSTLSQIAAFLNEVALAVNTGQVSSLPASTIAAFKVNIVTARTEVNTTLTAVTAAQSAYLAAVDQLTLAQAGATSQDIEAQKAALLQAQAGASSAQVALQHAELIAPFSGTAENVTAKIGQVVTPGVPMVSLISANGIKFKAFVSEADVAKVKTGEQANVTLDAFGTDTVFPATVATVASVQTSVNGAPAYEVDLDFTNPASEIKDGLTGNAHIILGQHANVVEVPSRLVIQDGNQNYVLVEKGGQTSRQPVTIGLVGDDGMTEIVSGVNAGDSLTNF
ncbi:MAG TPA: efflux RND transporter periplasmic adaptor subunit [Candidatus Paceibacterota bacterium]|nr:efflux RND transporter periplasmic adaptor subunit [Candidatus Paceibacterota bacterium]